LDALLEDSLIAPKGRKEVPGRPVLWGTTPVFLESFGLPDIGSLPKREDFLLDRAPTEAAPDAPSCTPWESVMRPMLSSLLKWLEAGSSGRALNMRLP